MSETTYETNGLQKIAAVVVTALDAFQEAAILNGEGAVKYSIMCEKRRQMVREIENNLYALGRAAYDAGFDAGAAKMVAK